MRVKRLSTQPGGRGEGPFRVWGIGGNGGCTFLKMQRGGLAPSCYRPSNDQPSEPGALHAQHLDMLLTFTDLMRSAPPTDSESVSRCLGEWGWVLRSVFEVRVSVSCVSRLPPVFLNRSVCPCVPAPPGVFLPVLYSNVPLLCVSRAPGTGRGEPGHTRGMYGTRGRTRAHV